jgi:hypothetical protein
MRRVAHPYTRWEDYRAGMYDRSSTPTMAADDAFELLTDPERFAGAITAMLEAWPTAAENQLTRPGAKSWSWLGAAACMHAVNVPQHCTRAAWWLMSKDQQDAANEVAEDARQKWALEREGRADA